MGGTPEDLLLGAGDSDLNVHFNAFAVLTINLTCHAKDRKESKDRTGETTRATTCITKPSPELIVINYVCTLQTPPHTSL